MPALHEESFIACNSREICFLQNVRNPSPPSPHHLLLPLDGSLLCAGKVSHLSIALQCKQRSLCPFSRPAYCKQDRVSTGALSENLPGSQPYSWNSIRMLKGEPTRCLRLHCSLDDFICKFGLQGLWTVLSVFLCDRFYLSEPREHSAKMSQGFLIKHFMSL